MRVSAHHHPILLMEDYGRDKMRKVQRLNLHHHLEEVERRPPETRRQRKRGMKHVRHPLCVIIATRNAIELLVVGTHKYVSFLGRKVILRHIVGRSKPRAKNRFFLRGGMERKLPQTKNKLRGT